MFLAPCVPQELWLFSGPAPHLRPPEAQGVARQVSAGALGTLSPLLGVDVIRGWLLWPRVSRPGPATTQRLEPGRLRT